MLSTGKTEVEKRMINLILAGIAILVFGLLSKLAGWLGIRIGAVVLAIGVVMFLVGKL